MSNFPHDMSPEALHCAGATVRDSSPFSNLDVPVAAERPSPEFIAKWVLPFYMLDVGDVPAVEAAIRPVIHEVDESLVTHLLSQPDWRPRLVGAYFAAICRLTSAQDHIGRLLLRSDVCYAGRGYCLALATFDTPSARDYLCRYLDYYLTQPDLWFDQNEALAALACLDEINGTSERKRFESGWLRFVEDKPSWHLDRSLKAFTRRWRAMQTLAPRMAV